MATVLASADDVADVLVRPLTDTESIQVPTLLVKASAKLRQAAPWDIDARIGLFTSSPTDPMALDPIIVADVVATMVKRLLNNPEGLASTSESEGDYSFSGTFVNRYDKSGTDVRGALQVTPSDIDQLKPASSGASFGSIRLGTGRGPWRLGTYGAAVADEHHLARPSIDTVLVAEGLE